MYLLYLSGATIIFVRSFTSQLMIATLLHRLNLQIYIYCCPSKAAGEVNLSMVWCILVAGFAYKLLMSLTGLYFEGEEAQGERSLVIVMAAAYLFFAMMILIGTYMFCNKTFF